jgi:MFS family permease
MIFQICFVHPGRPEENRFHNVQAVGQVQGLKGLATVLTAIPVGIFSDKFKRHHIARFASCLDAAAIATSTTAILANASYKFVLFLLASVFWGMSGACDSSVDALFADSVPTGQRAAQFTRMISMSRVFLGAGPLLAATIFHFSGVHLVPVSSAASDMNCRS